jgi:hypothetical protein
VASHSILFELEKPFAPFVSLLAMCNTFIVPHEDAEGQPGGLAAVPVGSVPLNGRVVMVRQSGCPPTISIFAAGMA